MIGVTRAIAAGRAARRCDGVFAASWTRRATALVALIRRPTWLWRLKQPAAVPNPCRQIEIIGELATWPILPILQTMF
jgi:hypothetical protein